MHMRAVMGPTRTVAAAALACGLAISATGCSGNKPSADKCETVSAQLSDIPTRTDQEPKLRIPVPEGWERATKMDSEQIRFAIRNPKLAADGFTPNAVVTLQKAPSDIGKPDQVLQAQTDQLVKKLDLTDVNSTPTKVCGAPALSSSYTTPEIKLGKDLPAIPARKATSLGVIYRGGDAYYVATVTVQTVKADDQAYVKDSEQILKGFQILPPR
jgi:hypothetical protein